MDTLPRSLRRNLAQVGLIAFLALQVVACAGESPDRDAPTLVGLITKTDQNPFFVAMREAAEERAEETGLRLRTYTGDYDGDWETQVEAIEDLIAEGADSILITPSNPEALAASVRKAREAGLLVIALDTPFGATTAVDATYATDNFQAGEIIGRWARAVMDASGTVPMIATLNGDDTGITVDVLRNQGFLSGYGIDLGDPATMGDEEDNRLVASGVTRGTEAGGRSAMAALLQEDPMINVVYTVNEPAAFGADAALTEAGRRSQVLLVSIDGGCTGVQSVEAGRIDATAMQFPRKMAVMGVDAAVEFADSGTKPEAPAGTGFHDTGVTLVTERPVPGIPSVTARQARAECWG